MLFRGASEQDDEPNNISLYSGNNPAYDSSHLQLYVETPPAVSRRGTFMTGNYQSPPGTQFPSRRWTQADQSRVDDEKKKKAMKELVTSWQDRLQLISVITTFFAGMEAQLLGIVTPDPDAQTPVRKINQAALVGLSSALVMHAFAAILSFIAAFFLVRFRVQEATHDEIKAELGRSPSLSPTSQTANGDAVEGKAAKGLDDVDPPIFSTDPHLEQVGPWDKGAPPMLLLDHCHALCMFLSMIGFTLAMVGIMCYIWAWLPLSSSVVSTAFVGFCIALGMVAIFAPKSFSAVAKTTQSPFLKAKRPHASTQPQEKLPGPRGL